jgi:nitroreductase
METLTAIQKRCSLKTHTSGRRLEPENIEAVLEAARAAPSARNMQPWRFIVVQEEEKKEMLVNTALSEANVVAGQAAAVIVVCARPEDDISVDGKEYYLFDVGLAVENMLLAATDLGLVTHLLLRFDEQQVKKILNIPADYRVVIVTPLAYPLEGSYEAASGERLSERTRKELKELVFTDHWEREEDPFLVKV